MENHGMFVESQPFCINNFLSSFPQARFSFGFIVLCAPLRNGMQQTRAGDIKKVSGVRQHDKKFCTRFSPNLFFPTYPFIEGQIDIWSLCLTVHIWDLLSRNNHLSRYLLTST